MLGGSLHVAHPLRREDAAATVALGLKAQCKESIAMASILRSGKDPQGKDVYGYVDAEDLVPALQTLNAKGVTGVLFHTDGTSPVQVALPDNPSPEALSRRTKHQIAARRKPSFATLFKNVFGSNKSIFLVALVLLVSGWLLRNIPMVVMGLAVEAAPAGYAASRASTTGPEFVPAFVSLTGPR